MADTYADILERARQFQAQQPPEDTYDAILDRARDMELQAGPVLPSAVSRHVTPLPGSDLPEGSTPASDGINTKREGTLVADPAAGRNLVEEADTFVRRSVKGLPIVGPSLDRLATGAQSRTSGVPVEELQANQAAADARNPGTATAGELTGTLAGSFGIVAAAPQAFGLRAGAGTLERIAGGFGGNAVLAGSDIAARGGSNEEVVKGAAVAGIVGAVLTPYLARIGGDVGGRIEGTTSSPAAAALREQATAMYGLARQSGVNIKPQAFSALSKDIRGALQAENFSERFIPQTVRNVQASLDDAVRTNTAVPLERLELLRQEIVPLTRGATPELASQRRLAGIVLQKIDDFGEALGQARYPITNGVVTAAEQQAQLRLARELWRQQRNVTVMDEALQRAQTYTSGLANGIRSEFASLSKNRKFMSGLNTTEREAIRGMASAANVRGMLMMMAKMDPNRSNLKTMAILGGGALASGGTGFAAGLGVLGAGWTAAKLSGRVMTNRANQARRVLAGEKRVSSTGKTLGGQVGVVATQAGERDRRRKATGQ